MAEITRLKHDLRSYVEPQKAESLPQFFKAFPGGYGAGDKFLGITVPNTRKVAKKYKELELTALENLIHSPWHEERLCGFLIASLQFARANVKDQDRIYRFVTKHKAFANNWDLVDLIGPKIISPYLYSSDRSVLYKWAKSKSLWTRRLAIMSTFYFIKNDDFSDTLAIAEYLLWDDEDLIHKAVGWMLREVGNRSINTERKFLRKYSREMPRTMLRYAIEKFSDEERQKWLKL